MEVFEQLQVDVYKRQPQDNGLVIGYGNTSADRFPALVRQLGKLAATPRR